MRRIKTIADPAPKTAHAVEYYQHERARVGWEGAASAGEDVVNALIAERVLERFFVLAEWAWSKDYDLAEELGEDWEF